MAARRPPVHLSAPRVRALRIAARLSQSQLARLAGYSASYVANVERGVHPVTGSFAARLHRALRPSVVAAVRRAGLRHRPDLAVVLSPDPDAVAGAQVAGPSKACSAPGCPNRFIPNSPRRRRCYTCAPPRVRKEIP